MACRCRSSVKASPGSGAGRSSFLAGLPQAAAQREIASLRSEQDRLKEGRTRAARELTELSARRDKLASDVEDVSRRHATAQAQLATVVDDMAARNREFAELDGRVQAARRELAAVQGQLADARAQLSGQPATEAPSAPALTQGEQSGSTPPSR
jgi:chromosome segregation ATPase